MIDVMIVDDEYIVREDLHELIQWEEQGFRIVAEAQNGQQGIKLFDQFQPQLILTDIKMPVMGGLDMINVIIEKAPQTQFILLTAYEEFDYARKAMEKGISAYLLKHEIDEDSLLLELKKAEAVIRTQNRSKREKKEEGLKKRLLAREDINLTGVEEKTDVYGIGRSYLAVLMLQRGSLNPPGAAVYEIFENALRTKLQLKENDYLIRISEEEYVIICDFTGQTGYRARAERMEMTGRICRELAAEYVNMRCVLSFSRPYDSLYSLSQWYGETKHIQEYRYFERGKDVFRTEDYTYSEIGEARRRKHHEYRKELRKALQNEDADRVNQIIQTAIKDIQEHPDLGLWDRLIDLLELSLCHENISTENRVEASLRNIKGEVAGLCSADEVSLYFQNKFRNLFERKQAGYSPRIEKALDYIKGHYQENITLKEIAAVMDISEIYASQLFKKVVGVSFMRYFTEYRMKIAKELILQGYKVYEVSEMIGYQTVQYFTTMFKKYEGCTPKEYYSKMEKKHEEAKL